jgi:predicted transcriptional regulator
MIVKEIMNHEVVSCRADTTLESAAILMWDGDCGTVAVVIFSPASRRATS